MIFRSSHTLFHSFVSVTSSLFYFFQWCYLFMKCNNSLSTFRSFLKYISFDWCSFFLVHLFVDVLRLSLLFFFFFNFLNFNSRLIYSVFDDVLFLFKSFIFDFSVQVTFWYFISIINSLWTTLTLPHFALVFVYALVILCISLSHFFLFLLFNLCSKSTSLMFFTLMFLLTATKQFWSHNYIIHLVLLLSLNTFIISTNFLFPWFFRTSVICTCSIP